MIIELISGKSLEVSKITRKYTSCAGIYIVYNELNKKFYIGSAINVYDRKCTHFKELKGKYHPNKHLQHAFDKYGKTNFKIYLIENINIENSEDKIKTKELILSREQYYIDSLEVIKYGYNICPVAGNTYGRPVSQETREKIRKANLGKKHSPEAKRKSDLVAESRRGKPGTPHTEETKLKLSKLRSKKLVQLDLGNVFIKEWESTKELSNDYPNLCKSSIAKCCKGKQLAHGGFKWFWSENYYNSNFIFPVFEKKTYNPYNPIVQLTLDLHSIKEWHNSGHVAEFGFDPSAVLKACKNRTNYQTHKGFKWMYLADYEKLKQDKVG